MNSVPSLALIASMNGANTGLSFRLFTHHDLPIILDNEQHAHAFPWPERNFISSLASAHHCIMVTQNDKCLGHLVISLVAGEAELLLFVIAKRYWHQGLGKKTLRALCHGLQASCSMLFLEVREGNEKAIQLYESVGFNQIGLREDYYPGLKGRESACVYAIELSCLDEKK